jgi:hypothetical protein
LSKRLFNLIHDFVFLDDLPAGFAGKRARATKISTGRLPLRAIFSPA